MAREAEARRPERAIPAWKLGSRGRREAKLLEIVEDGHYTREVGREKIAPLRSRIASLEMEAQELRKVVEIAPGDIVEQACHAVASGPEPDDNQGRHLRF